MKGYAFLWLGAAALPALALGMLVSARQNETAKGNAFRYIIAKRSATAEHERNQAALADMAENEKF